MSDQPTRFAWATWRATLSITFALFLIRIAYLALVCPYDLVADEAQYWDWSRNLELSYYTKGPGVAWIIAGSTWLFGSFEWAIRLPATLATTVTMLAVAKLATESANGDERAGFFAAVLVALCPPFVFTAQVMTIDAPFFACWALAATLGWRVMQTAHGHRAPTAALIGLGAVLGVGFLFKYTILLLVPGLIIYVMLNRRRLALGRWWPGVLIGLLTFFGCISPVILWNHQHDWPTVSHLLGHLHVAGGDVEARSWSYEPKWTLAMVGTQIGAVGVPLMVLMVLALIRARRLRHDQSHIHSAAQYAFWCGLPVWAFYFGLSFMTDVEGNWPLPAYLTWLVPVAVGLLPELSTHQQRVSAWLADSTRPKMGFFRAKPETPWQIAWHWAIGWGIVATLAIMAAPWIAQLPVLRDYNLARRVTGHHERAAVIQQHFDEIARDATKPPIIITDRYSKTALLAFYLPNQPTVYCASPYMGDRRTPYDLFEATNLTKPELYGRDALLYGGFEEQWRKALGFDEVDTLDKDRLIYFGRGMSFGDSAEDGS